MPQINVDRNISIFGAVIRNDKSIVNLTYNTVYGTEYIAYYKNNKLKSIKGINVSILPQQCSDIPSIIEPADYDACKIMFFNSSASPLATKK